MAETTQSSALFTNGNFLPLNSSISEHSTSAPTNGVLDVGHYQSANGSNESLAQYQFPINKMQRVLKNPAKTPLCLVACGSFSPITYLHLRMFEMAADYVRHKTQFEFVGGFFSPVGDAYKKVGLARAYDRIKMCELATETTTSKTLNVDPWEALQTEYQPTAIVLDHFEHELNEVNGGIACPDGTRKPIRVALLAGADLIETMSTPNLWSEQDLNHILGRYGSFIVERSGTDIDAALASLKSWRKNIYVIKQFINNDVSSTKIRNFLKKDMSVSYLVPVPVVEYIRDHGLYEGDGTTGSLEDLLAEQNPTEEDIKIDGVANHG